MPDNDSVRVLIVDDDRKVVERLTNELDKLGGYKVQSPDGAGDALVQNTTDLAPKFRPHVVVLDLCLIPGSSEDYMGFKLHESLKSARIIPYSSYLTPEATAQLYELGVEPWVSKGAAPTALLAAIAKAAKRAAACRSATKIARRAAWKPAEFVQTITGGAEVPANPPPDMPTDILCQLFPDAQRLHIERLSARITSSEATVRGRSVVRAVFAEGQQPAVVKWALAPRVHQEWANYAKYVHLKLGELYYPLANPPVEFWDLGGMRYTLMGGPQQRLDSFARWYERNKPVPETIKPLAHLFDELWGVHYGGKSGACRNLYRAYNAILHLTAQKKRLRGRDVPPTVRALGKDLPDPLVWAHRRRAESSVPTARTVVTHGDLHADNFFVDESHAWPIDFERTGSGPRLRDFAELEVDIVTRLVPSITENAPPDQDLPWFLPLALAVAGAPAPSEGLPVYPAVTKDPRLNKAWEVINEIRRLAFSMTHFPYVREYLWNLLLDAAWVTCHADRASLRHDRAFLLGALLCQRLEDPEGEWPPPAFAPATGVSRVRAGGPGPVQRLDRSPRKRCLFLSYNRSDEDAVREIAHRLETTRGIPVWLDQWNLLPGDPWQEDIETALVQSRACAVFWGSHGPGTWQREEMRVALDRRARDESYRVIPVLLPGARKPRAHLPPFLQRVTWVDMRHGLDDDSFNALVAGITGRPAEPEDA